MAKAEDVVINIRTDNGKLESGLNNAQKKLGDFSNSMAGKIGGVLAGTFATERIAEFTRELVLLSGEAEGVRSAFSRIEGGRYMEDMKKATAGTVSELELMKRTVSANNLGLPVENLANLFQFATKRAQDTGQSVDYLVDSIVMGIGRKSPLILDNLGISAVQLKEKLKGVGMETATTADIARAVGEIAADSLTESGAVIETNSIKVQQLTAAWENLKMSMADSTAIQQGGSAVLNFLNAFVENLPRVTTDWYNWGRTVNGVMSGGLSLLWQGKKEYSKQSADFVEHIDEESNAFKNNIAAEQLAAETKKRHGRTIEEIEAQTEALKVQLKKYGEFQVEEIQATKMQIDANEKLIKSLTTLAAKRETVAPMSKMETITDLPQIGEPFKTGPEILMPEFDKIQQAGAGYMDKYKQLMSEQQAEVDELNARFSGALAESLAGGIEAAFSGQGLESTLIAFLNPISNFLTTEGSMLIAHGIAVEAFKKSLTSLNGIPAIVAGAAMVATGAAFKGFVKGGLNNSGAGYATGSGGYGGAGGFGSGSGKQSVDISGQFEVKGNDLVYILAKAYNNNNRTRT